MTTENALCAVRVRRVGNGQYISLPVAIRRALGVTIGDQIVLSVEGSQLLGVKVDYAEALRLARIARERGNDGPSKRQV